MWIKSIGANPTINCTNTRINKSESAAQDPWSTVQFNPPLFWKKNKFGDGVIFWGGFFVFNLFIFTVQYCIVQYSTVQYSTVQYSTVQYSTVQYSTVQYSTVQYNTVQHSPTQPPKLVVWRRRRRRRWRKSPSVDPRFHLRGPWVKITMCIFRTGSYNSGHSSSNIFA